MNEEPIKIVKHGYNLPFTWEYLFGTTLRERTIKSKKLIKPTKAEVKAFHNWEARYEEITAEGRKAGWYSDGYEGPEITEPESYWEYEYEEVDE